MFGFNIRPIYNLLFKIRLYSLRKPSWSCHNPALPPPPRCPLFQLAFSCLAEPSVLPLHKQRDLASLFAVLAWQKYPNGRTVRDNQLPLPSLPWATIPSQPSSSGQAPPSPGLLPRVPTATLNVASFMEHENRWSFPEDGVRNANCMGQLGGMCHCHAPMPGVAFPVAQPGIFTAP